MQKCDKKWWRMEESFLIGPTRSIKKESMLVLRIRMLFALSVRKDFSYSKMAAYFPTPIIVRKEMMVLRDFVDIELLWTFFTHSSKPRLIEMKMDGQWQWRSRISVIGLPV